MNKEHATNNFFSFLESCIVRQSDKMFTFQLPNYAELICRTHPS
uniref:Uncharacterized protein n=1 Tax=Arundo donax TaxID=35708 RepID=A0A0A9HMH9_ARUDO